MLTVEIDGNDGTGKTFLINEIKKQLSSILDKNNIDIKFNDRGLLSKATLSNVWELNIENPNLNNLCKFDKDTIYYLIDDIPEKCQERILSRGDSIEEEYHTLDDLIKYRKRFLKLKEFYKYDINLIKKNGHDFWSETIKDIIINILSCYYKRIEKSLKDTKTLINAYKEKYGNIDLNKYIQVTKSNLQKILLPIDDILRFESSFGTYNNVKYNAKIICKEHTYYVIENEDTIKELYKNAKMLKS